MRDDEDGDYEREPDHWDCDHADADLNIIDGRACCPCGYSWWMTEAEITAEVERQREYAEWQERQERWARWYRLTACLRRKHRQAWISDDEIPF